MQSAAVHYPFGQSFRNVITVLKLLPFLRFGCCWPLCMWVVAEWLACWTQAQMGLGSNRACSAWMWPVGVDPVWSVWVVCCVTCWCRSSVVCVGGLFVCRSQPPPQLKQLNRWSAVLHVDSGGIKDSCFKWGPARSLWWRGSFVGASSNPRALPVIGFCAFVAFANLHCINTLNNNNNNNNTNNNQTRSHHCGDNHKMAAGK